MLETMNDYLSFAVLIVLVLAALRVLVASMLNFKETASIRQMINQIVHFSQNEDE